jgi:DHA3 family macrolide efflux protein-like MFS transporter
MQEPENADLIKSPQKLFNKDYVLLWMGQIVSATGNSIQYIALMWWIMEKFPSSQSGIVIGWMFAFNMIPVAAIGPFAGVLVDRIKRKTIVVVSDTARGGLILWMAYLAYEGRLTVGWVYLISALMGVGSAFFRPALQASIPNIVPDKHLTRANSLFQGGMQFTQIIGPAVGGVLVGFFGASFVFAINGISFLISAFTELFINFRQNFRKAEQVKTFLGDFKEGIKFTYTNRLLFWIMIIASVMNFAFAPVDILIAKQIKMIYGLGALELGYVVSAFAGGMIIGAGLLSLLPELRKKHNVIILNTCAAGLIFSFMGFAPGLISFLILALLIGLMISVANVLVMVVLQRIVPDEKRGRVFSVLTTFGTALQPVSLALIGGISVFLANKVIFLALGTMVAISSLFMYLVPGIKEI